MGIEWAGLVVGIVAAAVILPALIFMCGTRKKEAPISASLANRRAAAIGKVAVDPLLKPDWAAKQAAAQDAQQRQQHSVVVSSKNLRTAKGSGGSEEHIHVIMRQPSTMADKYALPSHLTKQLGQPSRRGLANNNSASGRAGTPTQDGSVGGGRSSSLINDRQSGSATLQKPDPAYIDSSVTSISRSGLNDSSAARNLPSDLSGRASRRIVAPSPLGIGSEAGGLGPGGTRTSVELSQMEDGSGLLRPVDGEDLDPTANPCQGTTGGVAWPGLGNSVEPTGGSDSAGPASVPPRGAALPQHPRVAALSPLPPRAPLSASAPEPSDGSPRLLEGLQREQQPSAASDLVESLVAGVDWSAAVVGEDDRRVTSATGGPRVGADGGGAASREQNSAPPSTDVSSMRIRHAVLATVPSGDGSSRSLGGGGSLSRTISGRDGGYTRIGSRLGNYRPPGSMLPASSASNRWAAHAVVDSGDYTPSGNLVAAIAVAGQTLQSEPPGASLPGSAEAPFIHLQQQHQQQQQQAPADTSEQPGVLFQSSLGTAGLSSQRSRGLSFGTERVSAAGGAVTATILSSVNSLGGPGSGSGIAARGTVTWSGMTAAPLVDVDAGGRRASGAVGDDPASQHYQSSRAARAAALLERNKSHLARLAASMKRDVEPSA